jgi:HSP20 family molecular chaperone IbpA
MSTPGTTGLVPNLDVAETDKEIEITPGIDPKTVKATMSKGVLKITLPKPTRTEAQKIQVKEAA